jgi:hypothetical protein
MKALRHALAELGGLFVEDRASALAIACVLAVVGGLAATHRIAPQYGGPLLFAGLACQLIVNVFTAANRPSRGSG